MSHTNATAHYALSQFIATDTPGWMSDVNQDNSKIDTAIYNNATDITANTGAINTINSKLTAMLPDAGATGSVLQKTALGAVWSNLFDLIYPVGSIYMTENDSFDPSVTFSGTWIRIQDRFLLAAGTTYAAGTTGGEAAHNLTVAEMPEHAHKMLYTKSSGSYSWGITYANQNGDLSGSVQTDSSGMGMTGGGEAHNNMPPYLTVMVWKRVA